MQSYHIDNLACKDLWMLSKAEGQLHCPPLNPHLKAFGHYSLISAKVATLIACFSRIILIQLQATRVIKKRIAAPIVQFFGITTEVSRLLENALPPIIWMLLPIVTEVSRLFWKRPTPNRLDAVSNHDRSQLVTSKRPIINKVVKHWEKTATQCAGFSKHWEKNSYPLQTR